jgi:hypothetical protein
MVYASSMGSLKARRVTINDLIGGSNGGATSALTISNEGSDATGSVIITAASGKTSGFTTSSNGAKVQLQGEVQLGSANHAAQVFTHSSVTTDLHLKSTNGSAGILMDPGSSTVTNTGNLVLLGGDLTATDKRLTLFTSGASSHDIYLDPRTNTAGGDVYVRANLSINQTTLSATHPSGFDVTAVEQLALTTSAGNVATTASAGNVVVTAAHNVALTPSGDLLATATGNVAVACVDATLDASNVAVVDGALGASVVSAAAVALTAGTDVDVTAGGALTESVTGAKQTTAGTGVATTATTGNVATTASAGNVVVTAAHNVALTPSGDLLATATGNVAVACVDATLDASNVAVVDGALGASVVSAAAVALTAGTDVDVTAGGALTESVTGAKQTTAGTGVATTATTGNVATTASAGNVVVTAAHNVALTPSGDLLATATGNVAVACVDATLDASNVAVVDGAQGVVVSASTAGDVELTSAAGVFALTADAATTASVVRSAQLLTIASTNADVALNAGANLTTTSYTLVGSHASGVRVVSTQSDVELEAASDVVLDPGSDAVRVVGGNTTLSLDGTTAANVVASTASLVLAAPTTGAYVSLEPQVATQTAMPLQFTSNTVSYHVQATSGPLRLRGSDASNTTIIEGNLEVAGTVNYITTDATTLLIEDKQLILNQADVSTDTTADQSGLVLNGSAYETDSTRLSVLWNKTDSANATANDDASFWRFSGGDLSVSRVIPQLAWTSPFDASETAGYQTADQVVEYRLAITGDEKLQIQKVRGRKSVGTNMNSSGVDRVVVAEYDLAV